MQRNTVSNDFLNKQISTVGILKKTTSSEFEIDFQQSRSSPIEDFYGHSDYKNDWIFANNFHNCCISTKTDARILEIRKSLELALTTDDTKNKSPYYFSLWSEFIVKIAVVIRMHEEFLAPETSVTRKETINRILITKQVWEKIHMVRTKASKAEEVANKYSLDFISAFDCLNRLFNEEYET